MANQINPTKLYVGKRDAVIAEASTPEFYEGKYLVQPDGDAQWDAIGCDTKKGLLATIKELRNAYPGIQVLWC